MSSALNTEKKATESPNGSEQGSALTKVTVNLIQRSMHALAIATSVTGDNRTDTINRALQIYAFLAKALKEGKSIYVEDEDGSRERLVIL